ncbi:11527_t:CDS:2, partial [Cetraspora pellucida]
ATTSLDNDLKLLQLNNDKWIKIKEVINILKMFIRTTNMISSAKYPMLASTIPIYNYLIDELEICYNNPNNSYEIATAISAGLNKLKSYYIKTNDTAIYNIVIVLDPNNYELCSHETTNYSQENDINDDDSLLDYIYENRKRRKKDHEFEYPCLAMMARDYHAISATSVPVEQIFSEGANLIDVKRSCLGTDTIHSCMCLNSW